MLDILYYFCFVFLSFSSSYVCALFFFCLISTTRLENFQTDTSRKKITKFKTSVCCTLYTLCAVRLRICDVHFIYKKKKRNEEEIIISKTYININTEMGMESEWIRLHFQQRNAMSYWFREFVLCSVLYNMCRPTRSHRFALLSFMHTFL